MQAAQKALADVILLRLRAALLHSKKDCGTTVQSQYAAVAKAECQNKCKRTVFLKR